MRVIAWVPLLACPAVHAQNTLLDKPAVAPANENFLSVGAILRDGGGVFIYNRSLLLRIAITIFVEPLSLPAQPVGEKPLHKGSETRAVVRVGHLFDGLCLSGIGMDHL